MNKYVLASIFLVLSACGSRVTLVEEQAYLTGDLSNAKLDTFIGDCLQIDELNGGPADANTSLSDDLADQSLSVDYPPCSADSYIDWNDLEVLSNHQMLDLDDESGVDRTSFPRSNECVAGSHVLSKMDLTYVAAANNKDYAYLAVQRSGNNGDAAYTWLFTIEPPTLVSGGGPCKESEKQLMYKISQGDVLIQGNFHPSDDFPLLRVFRATASSDVTAVEAIDYTSTLWEEHPELVAAVAVNTTITAPGLLGLAGVKSMDKDNLDVELFAEAAVSLDLFTGGASCGAKFFGSVITRSSGSGGTSPDLKDLAGPAVFNFGEMTATASLSPTCGLDVVLSLDSTTGLGGGSVENPVCLWELDDGSVLTECNTIYTASSGLLGGTLTVSDPGANCAVVTEVNSVDVKPPLAVSASLVPTCENTFTYSGSVDAGGPVGSTNWVFEGGDVTPSSSTLLSGSVVVGTSNVSYTGTFTVTDQRGDTTCTASASDSAVPLSPLNVNLDLVSQSSECAGDEATYQLNVVGGSGGSSVVWNGVQCSGQICTINPDDSLMCGEVSLSATVVDNETMCGAATSETEVYTKQTTITATDN